MASAPEVTWLDLFLIAGVAMFAVSCIARLIVSLRFRPRSSHPLDGRLLRWSSRDWLTPRSLLTGGVAILGRSSSGKSRASGRYVAWGLVCRQRRRGALAPSGGLILADKSESLDGWRKLFAACGREDDLIVFSPAEPWRMNFLEYASQLHRDNRSLVEFLGILSRGAKGHEQQASSAEHGTFWKQAEDRCYYNALVPLRLASGGSVTAAGLHEFIMRSAATPDDLKDEHWKQGFHSRVLHAAHDRVRTEADEFELKQAMDFWCVEMPRMAPQTRGGILANVMNTLHVFNSGLVRTLVSAESGTLDLRATLAGRWIYADFPPATYGVAASFIYAGLKYLMQQTVLQRRANGSDGLHVIWVDEAAAHSNRFDIQYLQEARSRRGAMVFLSQGVKAYEAAFGGESHRGESEALLNAFGTWIVHACDPDTAEAASRRLGKRRETFFSTSSTFGEYWMSRLFDERQVTESYHQSYEPVVQERAFMAGLRTGGPMSRHVSDAYVIRSGEPFSTGENFLLTSFTTR